MFYSKVVDGYALWIENTSLHTPEYFFEIFNVYPNLKTLLADFAHTEESGLPAYFDEENTFVSKVTMTGVFVHVTDWEEGEFEVFPPDQLSRKQIDAIQKEVWYFKKRKEDMKRMKDEEAQYGY